MTGAPVPASPHAFREGMMSHGSAECYCHALCRAALPTARAVLAALPWRRADGVRLESGVLTAPSRFAPPDALSWDSLRDLMASRFRGSAAQIFVGAAGIAVRAIAPHLDHKSRDPAVLVVDPAGRHVISLLSGHWGDANGLARHLARALGGEAVVTTASDTLSRPALDMAVRRAGLRLLDWDQLPAVQAALLESRPVSLYDPLRRLPPLPGLVRIPSPPSEDDALPSVCVHWQALPSAPARVRVAVPCLALGVGCRRDMDADLLRESFFEFCRVGGVAPEAVAALATVTEKSREPAIIALADALSLPLLHFPAPTLAAVHTPTPSAAAGRRFGLPPFSVCEAAALLAADAPELLIPKTSLHGCLTFALAVRVSGIFRGRGTPSVGA